MHPSLLTTASLLRRYVWIPRICFAQTHYALLHFRPRLARQSDIASFLSTCLSRCIDDLFAFVGLSRRHGRIGALNNGIIRHIPTPSTLCFRVFLPLLLWHCCNPPLSYGHSQAERKKERARIKKLREKEKKVALSRPTSSVSYPPSLSALYAVIL